jgi:hypothetical protein
MSAMHDTMKDAASLYGNLSGESLTGGELFLAENMKVAGALLNGDSRLVAGVGFEPTTFGL